MARFPPHCSLHYKAKLAIHIHNSQVEEQKWKYFYFECREYVVATISF
jgi:hypothetical protein